MTSTTIQLPDELHVQALALAETTGHTLEDVLTEAVAQGLAIDGGFNRWDQWFVAAVEQSLAATRAGQFASPDNVEAMWNRLTTPEPQAWAHSARHGVDNKRND